MLPDDVKKKIIFEISEIDAEIKAYKPLLKKCKTKAPDFIEMTALASGLHSFYNGIEKIFVIISKDIDNCVPSGQKWHNELLKNVKIKNRKRQSIITEETFNNLRKYLLFRHYYRHSYSWRLKWDEFSNLVLNLEQIWQNIKSEIINFIDK